MNDIKKGWLSVARRLQEFSSREPERCKLVTMTIAVDGDNNPIFWLSPKMQPIEPRLSREQFINLLSTLLSEDSDDMV